MRRSKIMNTVTCVRYVRMYEPHTYLCFQHCVSALRCRDKKMGDVGIAEQLKARKQGNGIRQFSIHPLTYISFSLDIIM